ncbi:MBL fold metallo-hydrolase [Bradyrhizobium septentrionale]|uniref:MBL fold metallo-hydrolase n=1 Tax=Bradyrhizobium septentrionale TaxID=1404411 RepID=A0ABZ2P0A0_9BRAD
MAETCSSAASLILEQRARIGEDVREMPGNTADKRVIPVAAPGDEPKFACRRVVREFAGTQLQFGPPDEYQGPYSPVKHRKTDGPALSVERIGKLDAVLLSHDHHFDNLDNAGRALLPHAGITYTTDSGVQRLGGNAIGLAPFETRVLERHDRKKLLVTATPARHGPVGVDAGDVVGFALGIEQPGDLLYVTGDTLWFEGTADVAKRFSPKLVVLFTAPQSPVGVSI